MTVSDGQGKLYGLRGGIPSRNGFKLILPDRFWRLGGSIPLRTRQVAVCPCFPAYLFSSPGIYVTSFQAKLLQNAAVQLKTSRSVTSADDKRGLEEFSLSITAKMECTGICLNLGDSLENICCIDSVQGHTFGCYEYATENTSIMMVYHLCKVDLTNSM